MPEHGPHYFNSGPHLKQVAFLKHHGCNPMAKIRIRDCLIVILCMCMGLAIMLLLMKAGIIQSMSWLVWMLSTIFIFLTFGVSELARTNGLKHSVTLLPNGDQWGGPKRPDKSEQV